MPREYRTAKAVSRDLMLVGEVECAAYNELAEIELANGEKRLSRVLKAEDDNVLLELMESSCGMNPQKNKVRFLEKQMQLALSEDMLGRVFDGLGRAIDNGPEIIPEKRVNINASLINPAKRTIPKKFIETGVSSIDVFSTLSAGQRLPIVSSFSLPHSLLATKIAAEAKIENEDEQPIIVFAAISEANGEAEFYTKKLEESATVNRTVMFVDKASDSQLSHILTPHFAMCAAQYFAFEKNKNVVVILSDMTSYANAVKELAVSRKEHLTKNSYDDFLYSSLASIYEKAGCQKDKKGSITLLPIVLLDENEKENSVSKLTASICDGQVVLSKELFKSGVKIPVDVLKSVSRFSDENNCETLTLSNKLFDFYFKGKEAQKKKYLFSQNALTKEEKAYCNFSKRFEREYICQDEKTHRSAEDSLALANELLEELLKEI